MLTAHTYQYAGDDPHLQVLFCAGTGMASFDTTGDQLYEEAQQKLKTDNAFRLRVDAMWTAYHRDYP